MQNRKLYLDKVFKDPLFWSVFLLNLFIVYYYGNDPEYIYNIILVQSVQTFAYLVAHYFLLRNTPIKFETKKYRLNRTRKKSDKNRKEFGTYIEKDTEGDFVYSLIFLIILCFMTVFLVGIIIFFNYQKNGGVYIFAITDLFSVIWAIMNAIIYYNHSKKKFTYSNAGPRELIAIPFFKFYIPLIAMMTGWIIVMKVVGDIISFVLSNPSYWQKEDNQDDSIS